MFPTPVSPTAQTLPVFGPLERLFTDFFPFVLVALTAGLRCCSHTAYRIRAHPIHPVTRQTRQAAARLARRATIRHRCACRATAPPRPCVHHAAPATLARRSRHILRSLPDHRLCCLGRAKLFPPLPGRLSFQDHGPLALHRVVGLLVGWCGRASTATHHMTLLAPFLPCPFGGATALKTPEPSSNADHPPWRLQPAYSD